VNLRVAAFVVFSIISLSVAAQQPDTTIRNAATAAPAIKPVSYADSVKIADSLRKQNARKVVRRAAILPGWGQVMNKQTWKLPIVYGALGVPAYLFFFNLETYKELKQAYIYKVDDDPANDALIPPEYKPLSANSLKYYRDQYRQNVDYSALAFILVWGLQVADAAVFANLRQFDVGDALAVKVSPTIMPGRYSGFSLVVTSQPKKHPSKYVLP
jgi:hypothetical protein